MPAAWKRLDHLAELVDLAVLAARCAAKAAFGAAKAIVL